MSTRQSTLTESAFVPYEDVQGASRLARTPTEAEIEWGITSEELQRRREAKAEPTTSRERRCKECGHRVTSTLEGFEAGHADGRKAPECSQHVDAENLPELPLP